MEASRVTGLFLGVLLAACPSAAQHAWYSFNPTVRAPKTFSSYLRWTQAELGDVYLATQFYTGCSGGYFGGQLHADGSHMILFSMWDFNATAKTAHGTSPWCGRFGGEGEGAHCGLLYAFEFDLDYRFALTMSGRNASGVFWSATVSRLDPGGSERHTPLGTIFIRAQGLPKDCAQLESAAVSFQEYYLGGHFYSAAAWRGPFLDGDAGVMAFDADADCGPNVTAPSNVSSVVPDGPAGRPNVFYQMGGSTPHGCERSMWRHRPDSQFVPAKVRPFVRRPTATRPTGQTGPALGIVV